MPEMKNVYWFAELSKDSLAIAGGKGANLGEMVKAGFPVPPGCAISTQAYRSFVKANSLDKVIRESTAGLDIENSSALDSASDKIKSAILSSATPSDVRADIVKAYNRLCGDSLIPSASQEVLVAVRSSATAEDLPTRSFAGEHASFLNVKGSEELILAVKKCWASLFEARAIYYRTENKFDHLTVAICVVVQKMVESQVSGVMFTVDPVSQDPNSLSIEAGFGLGEAIVSGMITPDRYLVDKSSNTVSKRQVNRQEEMIALVGGENKRLQVPEELQEARKLSDQQVLELAQYGRRLEAHYNFPQDVEWAIENDSLYIVQTRNITTLSKEKVEQAVRQRQQAEVEQHMQQIPRVESFNMAKERTKAPQEGLEIIGAQPNKLPQVEEISFAQEEKQAKQENEMENPRERQISEVLTQFSPSVEQKSEKERVESESHHLFADFFSKIPKETKEEQATPQETQQTSQPQAEPDSEEYYGKKEEAEEKNEENIMQVFSPQSETSSSSSSAIPVAAGAVAAAGQAAGAETILLHGLGASPGIAAGPVRIVLDAHQLDRVKKGDILVTEMTSPDFVPAMKRAAGIITDSGGSTCHAAIVSREMGVPCVVGTRNATKTLREDEIVTVDANSGVIYEGKAAIAEQKSEAEQVAEHVIQSPPIITGTKLYVNLAQPELAKKVAAQNVDGVGLLRAEFMVAAFGVHPRKLIEEGRQAEYVEVLSKGLRQVCAAFHPRPVIYRATDFKTNEYRNLEGGSEFEPHEENPMIGFRGAFRYIKDAAEFKLELEAIKRVREKYQMKNLWLMIPFVRTLGEFGKVLKLVEEAGLPKGRDFKVGIMCEIPSTVILAEEFCQAGADFFSIGSNDLTQLTLGLDRDNSIVAEEFDERDPALIKSFQEVITKCHKHGVPVGICGQAPSVYPELAEKLVEMGIDSISANSDVIDYTRKIIASAEQKLLLKKARGE